MLVGDSAGGNLAAAVSHYLATVSEMHCTKQYLRAQVFIIRSSQTSLSDDLLYKAKTRSFQNTTILLVVETAQLVENFHK